MISVKAAEYFIYTFFGAYGITPGVYVLSIFAVLDHPMEAREVFGLSLFFYLIIYRVYGIVSIYIDVSCLFRVELWGKQIVIDDSCTTDTAEEQCYGHTDEYFSFFHVPCDFDWGKVSKIGIYLMALCLIFYYVRWKG